MALLAILLSAAISAAQTDSSACALTVQVQPGETLSLLASRHLGSFAAYPAIVEATNQAAGVDNMYAPIDNPALIRVVQKLCIPAADGVVVQPVVRPATATPTATTRAVLTPTATPTPIPAADHPLVIATMRARAYPGSEIVIEQRLGSTTNGTSPHISPTA